MRMYVNDILKWVVNRARMSRVCTSMTFSLLDKVGAGKGLSIFIIGRGGTALPEQHAQDHQDQPHRQ